MAEIVGQWTTLAEAEKLTQSVLMQGIVETVIEEGEILPMMPVKQLSGKSLLYNRENSFNAEDGADFYDIGEQIPWVGDQAGTQVEASLKRIARQSALDNFIALTYNNINDYRAIKAQDVAKKVTRFAEHMTLYGDTTFGGVKQFDGLHALSAEFESSTAVASIVGDEVNIDNGNAVVALSTLRFMLDSVKADKKGRDQVVILMPKIIGRRFDAAYQEAGFVRSNVTIDMANLNIGAKEIGGRIMFFDGVPIIRSTYLQAEQANTGDGSDARALYSSGTRNYSIFILRFGALEDGGLEMLFGDPAAQPNQFLPFARTPFDKLENYDAGGERLVSYMAPALGAGYSLARLWDVVDGAITP
ncbi:hypothetical protein LCGC14_1908950 [marine sediment metagenome]|uniref:Major capsid protein n=1 Tax=marine sediment metagenome TaxID=412755 RepID=A0A0F9IS90_9ZZZZ